MKKDIQPEYNQTTITCACGNVLEVGSTKKDIKVDICSKCHPFWTGNLRQETAGGRADRLNKEMLYSAMYMQEQQDNNSEEQKSKTNKTN